MKIWVHWLSPLFCLVLAASGAPVPSSQAQLNSAGGSENNKTTSQRPGQQQPGQSKQQEAPGADEQPVTDAAEAKAEVEEAIKHLLLSQVEAWNHSNLQGFMNGYWHSPSLTFFSGATVNKGWLTTLQRYQQRYQGAGHEMGQLEFQDLNIDVLSKRSAVVTGAWQLTMSDGKKPHGLFTLIVKQMKTGWRIVHDHTSAE